MLYYVYTEDGDSVDEKLIREGLGEAWTRDWQHRDVLVGLGRETRRDKLVCLQ